MKDTITKTSDVLDLLMDAGIQKELKRVRPQFDRTALLNEILEAWPHGQVGFAKSVHAEFMAARAGGPERQAIIRLISNLISEETLNKVVRPVGDMSDAELAAAIMSVGPVLARLKETSDATAD